MKDLAIANTSSSTTSQGEVMGPIRLGQAGNLGKPGVRHSEMADEQNDNNNKSTNN